MKLTIEMSNRNRDWFLDRSIYLLSKQTLPQDEWELIIVDDGSTDQSEEVIMKYKKMNIIKNFHYIKNTKKRYDSQGSPALTSNIAIKLSSGDYILHTDPEIMPLPDWAEQHYMSHEGKADKHVWGRCIHPREYHIVTEDCRGPLLGNAYTDYDWYNIAETWRIMNEKIKKVQTDHNISDSKINAEFFNDMQAGYSLSKKLLLDIGGYEEFFCDKSLGLDKYGGDDYVFFNHLTNIGSKKIVSHSIRAIHIYHPKDGQGNYSSTYAIKYVTEHRSECQANLNKEWGLIKENGFEKVF